MSLFSYVSIEDRIPANHPLRRIRKLADQALDRLNPTFCRLHNSEGRPSVSPEQLLLASLLLAFYGIRSERLLLDQLHYNLLFHWFVGQRKISLALLAGWLPTHLEIRLYDTLPSLSLYRAGPTLLAAPFLHGALAIHTFQLELDLRASDNSASQAVWLARNELRNEQYPRI